MRAMNSPDGRLPWPDLCRARAARTVPTEDKDGFRHLPAAPLLAHITPHERGRVQHHRTGGYFREDYNNGKPTSDYRGICDPRQYSASIMTNPSLVPTPSAIITTFITTLFAISPYAKPGRR